MKAFYGGVAREIASGLLLIGGAQRRFTRVLAQIGGTTRTVATFTPPLSASITPAFARASVSPPTPRIMTVRTGAVQATPAGGQASYTYQWAILSGSVTISGPNMAAAYFTATVPAESTVEAVARVTVTDASGATATATVNIQFNNYSTS